MKPLTMAIPKNTKLRDDIYPLLQEGISIEPNSMGTYRSPDFPQVSIVEARLSDIIRFLRQGVVDIALMSDERAVEANTSARGLYRSDTIGLRQFGLKIEKPATMRYLVPKETAAQSVANSWNEAVAVSSYPNTLRRSLLALGVPSSPQEVGQKGKPFATYVQQDGIGQECYGLPFRIQVVDGQTETYLRNGLFPNTVFAFDLVRSGETARKCDLLPVGRPAVTAYPSLWVPKPRQVGTFGCYVEMEPVLEDTMALLEEKLARVVPLDKTQEL